MAVSGEIKILITAVNKAGEQIGEVVRDLAKVAKTLKDLKGPEPAKVGEDLTKVKKAGEEARKEFDKLKTSSDTLKGSFLNLTSYAKILAGGFLAFQSVQLIKNFADLAARNETLGIVLQQVGKNAGYTRTEINNADAAIQKLGITSAASKQSLTRFFQAGLSLEDAPKLARAAQDLAVIAGQSSSETFERLILNIQRLEVEGLRNIGIVASRDQAEKKYAIAIGISADALTNSQKQQALLNEVLSQATALQGTYEESLTTVGKQMGSLTRIQETLKVSLGNNLLPAYTAIVEELSKFLERMTLASKSIDEQGAGASALGSTVRTLAKGFFSLVEIVVELKDVLIVLAGAFVGLKLAGFIAGMQASVVAVGGLSLALKAMFIGVGGIAGIIAVVVSSLAAFIIVNDRARAAATALALGVIEPFQTMADEIQTAFLKTSQAVQLFFAYMEGNTDWAQKISDETSIALKQIELNATARRKSVVDAAKSALSGVIIDNTENIRSVTELITSLEAQREKIKELVTAFKDLKGANTEAQAEQLKGEISKARSSASALQKLIDLKSASKNLSDEDKLAIKILEEKAVVAARANREIEKYGTTLATANKSLKLDTFKITDQGIFSQESQTAVTSFKLVFEDATKKIAEGAGGATTAINTLKSAFKSVADSAQTKDDLKGVRESLSLIKSGGINSAELLRSASRDLEAATTRINETELSKFKEHLAKKRDLINSNEAIIFADLEKNKRLETLKIEQGLKDQEQLYKKGQVTGLDFFTQKKEAIEKIAALEEAVLVKKLASVDKDISKAKEERLTQVEVNNLLAKRIQLLTELDLLRGNTQIKVGEAKKDQEEKESSNEEFGNIEAEKAKQAIREEGLALTNRLRTAQQIYNDEVAKYRFLLEATEITQETFNKSVLDAAINLDEAEKSIKKTQTSMDVFAEQAARNIQNSFAEFLFDPFDKGLKGMLEGFATTMRKMAAELLAQELLTNLIPSFFPGKSAGVGRPSPAPILDIGSLPSQSLSPKSFTSLSTDPGFASNAAKTLSNSPLNSPVKVEIINNSGAPTTTEETRQDGRSVTRVIIGQVADDIRRGGEVGKALQNTFGLRRPGGTIG